MPRAFTDTDVIQTASGATVAAGSEVDPGVALPATTTEGNFGLIVVGAAGTVTPPELWHYAGSSGSGSLVTTQLAIMCRADLPAGEQSWPFACSGNLATSWAWLVEEWSNTSVAPVVAKVGSTGAANPTSVTLSAPETLAAAEYVAAVAALLIYTSTVGSGSSAWPSVSWSNGFTETDTPARGTGTNGSDVQLRVARYTSSTAETGPWSTVATMSGLTGKTVFGALAAFRTEYFDSDFT
jgi:hypothetical protein